MKESEDQVKKEKCEDTEQEKQSLDKGKAKVTEEQERKKKSTFSSKDEEKGR